MVDGGAATETQLLRWIPLLPLLAALFHGLNLGLVRRGESPRALVIALSCGSVLGSFLLSCVVFAELLQQPGDSRVLVDSVYTWIGGLTPDAQSFAVELGFRLDPISALMILIVTGVGLLIHLYSVGYMDDDHREDKGFQRFFAYLNLFTTAMLVLVLGDNLVLLFLGWEGVGLCSYLLIGFWYSDRWNAFCGSKAFIVNRIGDFGFLVGIFVLFAALVKVDAASLAFASIEGGFEAVAALSMADVLPGAPAWSVANFVALCFFVGAAGKSAQIPLYVWLPDAMAGPTPVSALIHAATMVTAGIYMICRLSFLFAAAPEVSALVAWVGALTAFFAATIAIPQTDIKKVLAYSTVSQLGYMFMSAGCGGYTGAMFHLTTHAFFKALLFLAAGSVILAVHHEQDVRKMGGLRRKIPQTHLVFLIGVIAIAGFPPLSGFFSKDEILVAAYSSGLPGSSWLYALGLGTAGLTSFYMFRLYFLVFGGELRVPQEVRSHIREPSPWVVQPLFVLALLSGVGGLLGIPQAYADLLGLEVQSSHSLKNFLGPLFPHGDEHHHLEHSTEYLMALAAIAMASLGLLAAWWLYVRNPGLPGRLAERAGGLYRLVLDKYYVDELYDAVVVRPLLWVSEAVLFRGVDTALIDGAAVNGSAHGIRGLADRVLKYGQSGFAQGYIFFMIAGAALMVGYLLG